MEKTRRSTRTGPSVVVRPSPTSRSRAVVQYGSLRLPAAIGRSGRSIRKKEGDGATPIAPLKLLGGFYRADQRQASRTALPMQAIRKSMLWCDDPSDPNYSRLVRQPFRSSHERLYRDDNQYDICLVLDWNISSRMRNRGSAIFFHLIQPGYRPTAGCIALKRRDMMRLLPFLRKGMVVRVV